MVLIDEEKYLIYFNTHSKSALENKNRGARPQLDKELSTKKKPTTSIILNINGQNAISKETKMSAKY